MEFRHLTTKACPTCGCTTVTGEHIDTDHYREPRTIRYHTNGQRWESREFLCGCVVEFVPNFSKDIVNKICPTHPQLLEVETSLKALRKQEEKLREKETALYEIKRKIRATCLD